MDFSARSDCINYIHNWLNSGPDAKFEICSTCNKRHIAKENKSQKTITQNPKSKATKANSTKPNQQTQLNLKSLNRRMAPISEKRSPPIISDSTKENISSGKGIFDKKSNKGPEIHDFRDALWHEVEICKDHIKNPPFLMQHNHVHTPGGCIFRDTSKDPVKTSEGVKKRLRSGTNPMSHLDKNSHQKDAHNDELVLKRTRGESYTSNSHQMNSNTQRNILKRKSPSPQPEPKFVINPYHASSLLGTVQLEKSKLIHPISKINSASTDPVSFNTISKHNKPKAKSPSPVKEIGKETFLSGSQPDPNPVANSTLGALMTKIHEDPLKQNFNHHPIMEMEKTLVEHKSDDGSKFDDDEDDFGAVDVDDAYEINSDSDEEYKGYAYLLDSDEENDSANDVEASSTLNSTPNTPISSSLFASVPPYLNFSSHVEKGPDLPIDLHRILKWKHTNVMPKVVKRVVINSGFRLIKKTTDWMGTWEKHMKSPLFKGIRSHQKYNHLPGTFRIGRKDSVWKNLKYYMGKHGKKEFGFMQKTYILPQDLGVLKNAWPRYARSCAKWIIKPPASARGTGIKVISRWSEIPKQKPLIVQKYIEKPLLINGNKFDLRLYVVVTSVNPLRIYLHTEGLARFAAVQYSDKLDTLSDRYMHLTNYSINKFSSCYAKNEDVNACQGHKWTLKSLWSYFRLRGINTKKLWGTLRNLVIRTVLSGEHDLNRMFKANVNSRYSCYELFGFDVLLDENLVPWLLEVNISPSLHSELPLDMHVKGPLVQAVLNTAMYQIPPKLTKEQEKTILTEYKLEGPLCFDRRLYTMCLSSEEIKKHNEFTSRSIDSREEYLSTILDDLTPDDIRCLIIAEDELARSSPLERIFPSQRSSGFLDFLEGPRYYNRLLDAWETKYGDNRRDGIQLLQKLCKTGKHLEVPMAALKQESVQEDLTEITSGSISDLNSISSLTACIVGSDKTDNATVNPTLETNTSCSKEVTIPPNGVVFRSSQPISIKTKVV